jgi:ribosome-associated protein
MRVSKILQDKLLTEVTFKFSRSSSSGGQHVNKVNTKVELRFNILQSDYLCSSQKAILLDKLKNRINNNNELILTSENERSQHKNKQLAADKFFMLIGLALTKQKTRKPTKPNSSSVERRLRSKKKKAEKKAYRRPIDF